MTLLKVIYTIMQISMTLLVVIKIVTADGILPSITNRKSLNNICLPTRILIRWISQAFSELGPAIDFFKKLSSLRWTYSILIMGKIFRLGCSHLFFWIVLCRQRVYLFVHYLIFVANIKYRYKLYFIMQN